MLKVFVSDQAAYAMLAELLEQPSVYDAFLSFLARRGLEVPDEVLQRDVRRPWVLQPALIPVFQSIYDAVDRAFDLYEACESLVDVEDNFQFWRFRHLRTVQRTIGFKTGTGGSSGVALLAEGIGLDLLSRALRGANRDRQISARFAVDDLWIGHRLGPTVLEDVAVELRPVAFGLAAVQRSGVPRLAGSGHAWHRRPACPSWSGELPPHSPIPLWLRCTTSGGYRRSRGAGRSIHLLAASSRSLGRS